MKFNVKYVNPEEINDAIEVETKTMDDYTYLKEANEVYQKSKGELIGIYDENKMIGIGRFTVLADNSGWLECLRVVPEYQHKGAGKLIYDEYLKLAQKYNSPSIAMYTGLTNQASSGLAEKYDLYTVQQFHGYHLKPVVNEQFNTFKLLTPSQCEDILKYKEKYHDFLSLSRTFYHFNIETLKEFAANGWVYGDLETNSFVIAGARWQHHKALHVALMEGDINKCLGFVNNLAAIQSIGDITFTLATFNPLEDTLTNMGASVDKGTIIVKERKF